MRVAIVVAILVVVVDLTRAQLNLPEMPGPPYPDKFGNNRWGVKYDPRVHGRGRSPHGAPSSTSGVWGGDEPHYSPGPRAPPPSRSKWTSALRPLVSRSPLLSKLKSKRKRRPSGTKSSPFDPTSDSFYKNPYSSKAIDGYVKNYLNTYNKVSQAPPVSSSGLVNIQNFARPTTMGSRFRSRNFARNGNRRSLTSESSFNDTSSLTDSYNIAAGLSDDDNDKAVYRTVNPQSDFFGPTITKKKSDFAKTLSSFYNDYKPGAENADSGISSNSGGNSASSTSSSSSNSGVTAAATDAHSDTVALDDDYPPSYSALPPPPPPPRRNRPRPPPSSSGGPNYAERPYGGNSKRLRGRTFSLRGPPPSNSYSSGPLSSLDMMYDDIPSRRPPNSGLYDDIPSYSSKRPPSIGLYDDYDSPMIFTGDDSPSFGGSFGRGSFSSSGPVRVSSNSMSGPPPSSSLYSSSFDSFGPGHFSSPLSMRGPPPRPNNSPIAPPLGVAPAPPPLPPAPIAPLSFLPTASLYYPPALIPLNQQSSKSKPDDDNPKKKHKSKRKKKRLQHTPMNVLRGLLGRGDRRDRYRERDRDEDAPERDTYKPAYAINYPVALPAPVAPPQYAYNPAVNTLIAPSPLNYSPVPVQPVYPAAAPAYPAYPPPPPQPPAPQPVSPLLSGIASLRDTISTFRDRPYRQRQAPNDRPATVTYITYNDTPRERERERDRERERENKKQGPPHPHPPPSPSPGPITQHLQDWPRIFTAMGASADAVFGGIHGVRKEISKMTGHTMAKGILMSGTAVHEVTKGMAHVITKMSAL